MYVYKHMYVYFYTYVQTHAHIPTYIHPYIQTRGEIIVNIEEQQPLLSSDPILQEETGLGPIEATLEKVGR